MGSLELRTRVTLRRTTRTPERPRCCVTTAMVVRTSRRAQQLRQVARSLELAAECINQRRREINQQMLQQCMDRARNNPTAGGSDAARADALTARENAERRLAETEAGTPERAQAERDHGRASARHTRMQRNACLAEQGAWLNNPNNQAGPCVVPNNPAPDDPVADVELEQDV